MKKYLGIPVMLLLVACLACGCGKAVLDADGNAAISSDWKLAKFTVNGKTEVMADTPLFLKVLAASKYPAFQCSDGVNCVLSNNGKKHAGTVTETDGVYRITFNNASKGMVGEISGKTLTLRNEEGTLLLVFETK